MNDDIDGIGWCDECGGGDCTGDCHEYFDEPCPYCGADMVSECRCGDNDDIADEEGLAW